MSSDDRTSSPAEDRDDVPSSALPQSMPTYSSGDRPAGEENREDTGDENLYRSYVRLLRRAATAGDTDVSWIDLIRDALRSVERSTEAIAMAVFLRPNHGRQEPGDPRVETRVQPSSLCWVGGERSESERLRELCAAVLADYQRVDPGGSADTAGQARRGGTSSLADMEPGLFSYPVRDAVHSTSEDEGSDHSGSSTLLGLLVVDARPEAALPSADNEGIRFIADLIGIARRRQLSVSTPADAFGGPPATAPSPVTQSCSSLSESELLQQIFDTSPAAITVLDGDGRIIRANARAEEVLGLTPSDLQNRSYRDPKWRHTTADGDPFPHEKHPFIQVKRTGQPVYDVRHAIEWPDGRRRILSISGAPLQSEEGVITGAVFVVEDITASYERQHITADRQRRVRALYEAMSRLLTLDTPEAVAKRMLRLVDKTMGYRISAVRLREGDRLVPTCVTTDARRTIGQRRPDYAVDGDSIVARAYRTGETGLYDDVRDAPDDNDRGGVRSTAYVPMGAYGIIAVGTTTPGGIDPFDVQLIEILARNAEAVLSRLVKEEELRSARDVAEEASRLKSAMLANMSHEVRTPLTSILGFTEVIEGETDDEKIQRFATLAHSSSLRLRDTLDSVLHLSRLEAKAIELSLQSVDLVEEVRETCRELRPVAADEDVSLTIDDSEPEIECTTDPAGVQRILRNLVGNAIKFTPPGGTVEVGIASGRRGALIEVRDTGVGMTSDFQGRMFDAFTQESEGLQREHEGSGLGLAIVHRLTQLLGGVVEVESTRGAGTRIAVFLPHPGTSNGRGE
jgi:PAS domain S-box-containing protein